MLYHPPPPPDVQIYSPNLFLKLLQICSDPIFRSFLRGQKVYESEFPVRSDHYICKEHKKRHRVLYSLYTKASNTVYYSFTA